MAPKVPGAWCSFPIVPQIAPVSQSTPPQKPAQIFPESETRREFGLTGFHKPFSLLDLRQIKPDLRNYTKNNNKTTTTTTTKQKQTNEQKKKTGKYIHTFQHLT